MSDHTAHRTRIAPVADDVARPRWSVMIPTFNSGRFLASTLESVLVQDPGPSVMQITVVDDHSTEDDPADVLRSLGAARVELVRQPQNVGHVRNFNTCLERSRGHLVHLLHGDDQVRPGFYEAMRRPFEAHPDVGAAFCRFIAMDERGHWHTLAPLVRDESGVLDGWLEEIALGQRLQAPSIVVRRDVYERVGGFDDRIRFYGEDWEMWVRVAAHTAVWYETEPLAVYRTHGASLSGRSARTGDNVRDLVTAIRLNKALLPPERAAAITRRARRENARGSLRRLGRAIDNGQVTFPLAQLRATIAMSPDWEILARSAVVGTRWVARRVIAAWRAIDRERGT
jgi:glycosyltransferase involved in cell wall biosynthesis